MIDQQRAAFEAWMRKDHPNHSLEYVNGRYTYSPPQRLWEAYQAALAAPEVQELRDALRNLYQAIDSCVELTPEVMRQAQAALVAMEKRSEHEKAN